MCGNAFAFSLREMVDPVCKFLTNQDIGVRCLFQRLNERKSPMWHVVFCSALMQLICSGKIEY